jgi:signal transduction histidine kinase
VSSESVSDELRWHQRLSSRLTLLLLGVVFVLAAATAVLLWRALAAVGIGAAGLDTAPLPGDPATVGQALAEADRATVGAILRSTLINLAVITAVTLLAATAFSRALLIEPINKLTQASRALAAGDLKARVGSADPSELGELSRSFDAMADSISGAQDRLEAQVAARTTELRSLLELSNTVAITSELIPQLEAVLDQLIAPAHTLWAEVLELDPQGHLTTLVRRGEQPEVEDLAPGLPTIRPDAGAPLAAQVAPHAVVEGDALALPLRVRDRVVGVLQAVAPPATGWDEERLRWISGLAAQAAVALENARLYDLARDEAADEERRHLARELHDSVSQAIYSVVLTAHAAQKHLPEGATRSATALDTVIELAEAALTEMRALIFELRPEALAEVGLMGALHRQLDGLELRHGLATQRNLGPEPELAFAAKQVLLRVAQEAFHNVTKHAGASQVTVTADTVMGAGSEYLDLVISDDGVGFDPTASYPGHLGLRSMYERVTGLEGRLEINSAPGAGTTVRVRAPLKAQQGEARA